MNRNIRLGLYGLVGAVSFVLLFLGYITPDHVDQVYILLGQLLGMAGSGVAMANLTPKNTVRVPVTPEPTTPISNRAPWLDQDQ